MLRNRVIWIPQVFHLVCNLAGSHRMDPMCFCCCLFSQGFLCEWFWELTLWRYNPAAWPWHFSRSSWVTAKTVGRLPTYWICFWVICSSATWFNICPISHTLRGGRFQSILIGWSSHPCHEKQVQVEIQKCLLLCMGRVSGPRHKQSKQLLMAAKWKCFFKVIISMWLY